MENFIPSKEKKNKNYPPKNNRKKNFFQKRFPTLLKFETWKSWRSIVRLYSPPIGSQMSFKCQVGTLDWITPPFLLAAPGRDRDRKSIDRSVGNWVCVDIRSLSIINGNMVASSFFLFYFILPFFIFIFFYFEYIPPPLSSTLRVLFEGFHGGAGCEWAVSGADADAAAAARHLRQDRIHSVRVLESIKCIFNRTTLKNTHTHTPDTRQSIRIATGQFRLCSFSPKYFPNSVNEQFCPQKKLSRLVFHFPSSS